VEEASSKGSVAEHAFNMSSGESRKRLPLFLPSSSPDSTPPPTLAMSHNVPRNLFDVPAETSASLTAAASSLDSPLLIAPTLSTPASSTTELIGAMEHQSLDDSSSLAPSVSNTLAASSAPLLLRSTSPLPAIASLEAEISPAAHPVTAVPISRRKPVFSHVLLPSKGSAFTFFNYPVRPKPPRMSSEGRPTASKQVASPSKGTASSKLPKIKLILPPSRVPSPPLPATSSSRRASRSKRKRVASISPERSHSEFQKASGESEMEEDELDISSIKTRSSKRKGKGKAREASRAPQTKRQAKRSKSSLPTALFPVPFSLAHPGGSYEEGNPLAAHVDSELLEHLAGPSMFACSSCVILGRSDCTFRSWDRSCLECIQFHNKCSFATGVEGVVKEKALLYSWTRGSLPSKFLTFLLILYLLNFYL
jgi:hypothetical protein